MITFLKKVYIYLSYLRFSPILILINTNRKGKSVREDAEFWCKCHGDKYRGGTQLYGY